MQTVNVDLSSRSYNVTISSHLIENLHSFLQPISSKKIFVITDENVNALHGKALENALHAMNINYKILEIKAGEPSKSWPIAQHLIETILSEGITRQDYIIGFGGGVIGDLTGFVASIILRGVGFIQIPTTLLAQVDSSVGGKTGINSSFGKNLIGAFYQPSQVIADISLLKTLPQRHIKAGYAEIVKCAIISDPDFFTTLENNGNKLYTSETLLAQAITKAVEFKANIVSRDEKEHGERALLNLGHTFAHAIETLCGYNENQIIHGEAVAIGLHLAAKFSAQNNICNEQVPQRIESHLKGMGLPTHFSHIPKFKTTSEKFTEVMLKDKKNVGQNITLILLKNIGSAYIDKNITANDINQFIESEMYV